MLRKKIKMIMKFKMNNKSLSIKKNKNKFIKKIKKIKSKLLQICNFKIN